VGHPRRLAGLATWTEIRNGVYPSWACNNPELDNLIPTIFDQLQEIYVAIVPIKELGSQGPHLICCGNFQQRFQINN
jgi:hypothetical protein